MCQILCAPGERFCKWSRKNKFFFVSKIWLGPHQHADMVNCAMLKDVPITILILNIQFYGIATSLNQFVGTLTIQHWLYSH